MSNYALIIDIGTTTVSGAIIDIGKSKVLISDSVLNEQIDFGDNVISRIDFTLKKTDNLRVLQSAAFSSINKLLQRLTGAINLKKKDIKEVFCVSNTAMHHLFLGIDASPLITPPYKTTQKGEVVIYAGKTDIKLKNSCPITFLPNIGGFVGSDALAVIFASGIYSSVEHRLVVDIGTNGEIIVGNKQKLFVASTAAGPAFEASHISCGMPAKKGAIESIKSKRGGIRFKVIGGGLPKGICGSGLIDAVAYMLEAGIISSSGRITNGSEFILYKKGKSKISITQEDIRKVQVAKAAISAAIKTLLKKSGKYDIKEAVVTGNFGNTLNADSVVNIGIIPKAVRPGTRFLKNGALEGLRLYVTEPSLRDRLDSILGNIKHLPLFGKGFAREFISSLSLGPIPQIY